MLLKFTIATERILFRAISIQNQYILTHLLLFCLCFVHHYSRANIIAQILIKITVRYINCKNIGAYQTQVTTEAGDNIGLKNSGQQMAPHIARGESRRLSLDIIYNDEVVQSIVHVETTDFELFRDGGLCNDKINGDLKQLPDIVFIKHKVLYSTKQVCVVCSM